MVINIYDAECTHIKHTWTSCASLQIVSFIDCYVEFISEFAEKHYKDFLEHQKLSKNVIHFIQHAISMTSDVTATVEVNFGSKVYIKKYFRLILSKNQKEF